MNTKVLLALAAIVFQAMCVESFGAQRALSLGQKGDSQKGDGDSSLGDNLKAQVQKAEAELKENVQDVKDDLQSAAEALGGAVSEAAEAGSVVVQGAIDKWNDELQQTIASSGAVLDSTVQKCKNQNPSLQDASDKLKKDLTECLAVASAGADSDLAELADIEAKLDILIDSFPEKLKPCESDVKTAGQCVEGVWADVKAQAKDLAAKAGAVAEKVKTSLSGDLPAETAACTEAAVQKRSKEATEVIANIGQCLKDSVPSKN